MKIMQFVSSLLPRVEKSNVTEDLRITISELDNVVSGNYKQAAEHFKVGKLKSDANKDLSDVFYRNFDSRGGKQPNFISEISKRMELIKSNTEYVLDKIEEELSSDIISEGLTFKKSMLVRASEQLSFISRFSIDLLNLVYVNEAIFVNAEVEESLKLAPAAQKHVEINVGKFGLLVSKYGIELKDFTKILDNVPDIALSKNTNNSVSGLYDEADIDPMASTMMVGFTYNPIYHIRLAVAEWQASRYKANKDKKKMLELRLLHLKLLQERKGDPKLEQEIVYIQGRVDKIERYLREVEDTLEKDA